jgi:hypothetical protein
MSDENKKTATERLEVLENTVNNIIQAVQPLANMSQDLMSLREAVKLLNNKLDAVVKCLNTGTQLTDENLGQVMTENNARDLQDKVTKMVSDGLLASTDTIGKDSFVVINEQDESGKIINPRMQFLLSALQNDEIRGKLEGAKTGTNIPVGDKGGSLNVLEAYNIVTPQAPEAPAEATDAEAAPAEASTAEASTAESTPEASTESAPAPAAETATA